MNFPHQQPFNRKSAIENAHHKTGLNLESRISDYFRMISQPKIGDGHRDANGYKRPGSNKK
jgi:hypothetical protein